MSVLVGDFTIVPEMGSWSTKFGLTLEYRLLELFCYKQSMHAYHHFSHVWLFVALWTIVHQAPLSMAFSREEYWSGMPCPQPGDLLDQGIEPMYLMSPELADKFFSTSSSWEALQIEQWYLKCSLRTLASPENLLQMQIMRPCPQI